MFRITPGSLRAQATILRPVEFDRLRRFALNAPDRQADFSPRARRESCSVLEAKERELERGQAVTRNYAERLRAGLSPALVC